MDSWWKNSRYRVGLTHQGIGRRSEEPVAVLYRRTADTQRKIISSKGDEITMFTDEAKRTLEVGLAQATETNERLWLHNRRMFDALYKIHESIKDMTDLPPWADRVKAALEDDEA
jgi:hypothetical protein